jgi:hypothetical protein
VSSGNPSVVRVWPRSALADRPRLFGALSTAFEVEFEPLADGAPAADGLIAFGDAAISHIPGHSAAPTLIVLGDSSTVAKPERFSIGSAPEVDARVRSITLQDAFAPTFVPDGRGTVTLAEAGITPVWACTGGQASAQFIRSALPELAEDEPLYALLSKRPLGAIAVVQLLRQVTKGHAWQPGPLRAAFLFDDPNLRWPRYGHISFAELASHARALGYHASMAMIPLDATHPHGPTVETFKQNRRELSLVVHGNDHTREELLAVDSDSTALALAAQALRRVAAFEHKTGLAVDRVMTPPHGRCSAAMARSLGAVGFDALSAIHPLPWSEVMPSDPVLTGWRRAEFVAGCPVVPRVPISSSDEDLALRAFLDHPLIVYGHHDDLAEGLDVLTDVVQRVNRFGDVVWQSIGEIVNANFETKRDGDELSIRPFARRFRMKVDEEVRSLTIATPTEAVDHASPLDYLTITTGAGDQLRGTFGTPIPTHGDRRAFQVRLHSAHDVDPANVAPPPRRLWPVARRAVAELRDRASPRTAQLTGRRHT